MRSRVCIATLSVIVLLALAAFGRDDQRISAALTNAESLLAAKPSEAVMVRGSDSDEYLGCTAWVRADPEIRIYRRSAGGTFKQVWGDSIPGFSLTNLKFFQFPTGRSPSLAFVGSSVGGNAAETKRAYLYSVDQQRLFFIEYSPEGNINATVRPAMSVTEDTATADPEIERFLRSWAQEQKIDGTAALDGDTLAGIEEEWLKVNGNVNRGQIRVSYHSALKDANSPGTTLEDDRYTWTSYFKGGVLGYDKQKKQYFALYVPEDRYDWIEEFRFVGQYLYLKSHSQDKSGNSWTVRVRRFPESNDPAFVLERGQFDSIANRPQPSTPKQQAPNSQVEAQRTDTEWRSESPLQNGRILWALFPAALAGVFWQARKVASGQKARAWKFAAVIAGVWAVGAAFMIVSEFQDAGKTRQQLAREKCGDVKAGQYGGDNLMDSEFNCLVQNGLAKKPSQEDVDRMARAIDRAAQEYEPPSAGVTVRPYELLRNPYQHKNRVILLDVMSRPVLYNGSVVQYAGGINPAVAARMGMFGLRFKRMLAEDTGLYDVMAIEATSNSEGEMVGQIAVVTPRELGELDLSRYWKVEPLGTVEGTNAFGAALTIPMVKFWGYN